MTNKRTTKQQLVASIVLLFMCFSMLLGTTFAWFTDSATSSGNVIKAGTLDVALEYKNPGESTWLDASNGAIFDYSYWEPGYTMAKDVRISNNGTLDLKFVLNILPSEKPAAGEVDLAEVIDVYMLKGELTETDREKVLESATPVGTLASLIAENDGAAHGKLYAASNADGTTKFSSETYTIVLKMQESAGNEYQGQSVGGSFAVQVLATQLISESDSFDDEYDADATYPEVDLGTGTTDGTTDKRFEAPETKVGVTVPKEAEAGTYTVEVTETKTATDAAGNTVLSMDITLKKNGTKVTADSTIKYVVDVYVGKNMDVAVVTHNGYPVSNFSYDPTIGIVEFETDSFSPFTITYTEADEDSVFLPADSEVAEKLEKDTVVAVDDKGNEYTTFAAAVKSGASKIYLKEGANLGNITHLDVANDLVIYGNGAYISGGERDLSIDTYVKLTKDTAITVYNLHGVAIWGQRNTEYAVNVNLYNCNDLGRVYINGTNGVNNIALYNCTANETIIGDTGVYSNANGSIIVDGCTFENIGCPINLNHKVAGEQKVTVTNTTFVDCSTVGTAAYYAPIRLYNSAEGANQTLTVAGNTFTYSEGKAPINKADVLLNAKHNGVDAAGTIKATVQAGADVVCGVNVDVTFEINTAEELFAFAADVNKYSNYERPFEGQTVKLMNDIDLGGAEWTPIGDYRFSANRFCGTFDGQGHTISNFKITKKTDKSDSNKSSYGFFGNMEGTVKNLTIDKANVCSYAYVGALVGRLTNGTVENCHVTNSTVETTYWQAGGMIGQLNDACTVKDCTITNTTVIGASAIGGMFGPLTATNAEGVVKELLFENCLVKDCAIVQKGSFGASYDILFGAMFCDIDVADNKTDINNCKVENTTVKDVVSNALFGSLSGTKVLFDGYEFVSDGLYKNSVNYRVYNANGLATLNGMMANRTAGRDVVVNLMADIDFAGKTWTPVDSHADTAFEIAEINGNGHTIKNLTINGQAMFRRFAGTGDVVIKDITFDGAKVDSTANGTITDNNTIINTSILTVQTYQNVLLDNVDVKNSTIMGGYKVAPLIATVYNESSSTITATLKNCDVSDTVVTATKFDFCTTGMVAFVNAGNADKIEFENCTVTNVEIYAPKSYTAHAWVYTTGSETLFNEVEGVTVSGCTFENK